VVGKHLFGDAYTEVYAHRAFGGRPIDVSKMETIMLYNAPVLLYTNAGLM
jgi:hypothetical protein